MIIVPHHYYLLMIVKVAESIMILKDVLINILQGTSNSGVPLGLNVESLSIFKEEINGAHELFQVLQVRSTPLCGR
jgi:hypothetical protein